MIEIEKIYIYNWNKFKIIFTYASILNNDKMKQFLMKK